MTRINPDDPKWTAYVLGELDDSERAAVDAELEKSEEARILVEELRFAADLTKTELRESVAVTPLTGADREKIRAAAGALKPRRWFGVRMPIWATGFALAGVVAIGFAVILTPAYKRNLVPFAPSETTTAKAEIGPQASVGLQAQAGDAAPPAAAVEFGLRYEHAQIAAPVSPADEVKPTPQTVIEIAAATPPAAAPAIAPARALPGATSADIAAPNLASSAGRVFGTVEDASAARIPGVQITATNMQTGASATALTNDTGIYSLDGLQAGNYKVTASLPGFQTNSKEIPLEANAQAKQDMTLQTASVSETVEVTANAAIALNFSESAVNRRLGQSARQTQPQAFAKNAAPPPPAAGVSARSPAVPPAFDQKQQSVSKAAETNDASKDNPFLTVAQNPLSAFSIAVDTMAYSNLRQYLNQNQLPPRDAVRIEEMINYFSYDYPKPAGNNPVAASIEAAAAPWNPQHRLVRVGIKARDIDTQRPGTPAIMAKDVEVQVEFNPAVASAYRMIGYENRALRSEDFNNDLKEAGDMSAGHTVTVLYEVVPGGVGVEFAAVDLLKDQPQVARAPARNVSKETLTVKIRYKEPSGSDSKLLSFPLIDREQPFARASTDFRFAAAVASFGMILRDSPHKGSATLDSTLAIAEKSIGPDRNGYRREFLQLVQRARRIRPK